MSFKKFFSNFKLIFLYFQLLFPILRNDASVRVFFFWTQQKKIRKEKKKCKFAKLLDANVNIT